MQFECLKKGLLMQYIEEKHILDCMDQLKNNKEPSYSESIQIYAHLRLLNLTSMLNDWKQAQSLTLGESDALPQVLPALQKNFLDKEKSVKLIQFLKHHAQNGNLNAILYLAYCYAKGQYVTQSPEKTAAYLHYLVQKKDWRAARFQAELLCAVPQACMIWLQEDLKQEVVNWLQNNTAMSQSDAEQNMQRFCRAPSAIKYAARKKMEQAIDLGSPFAAKRLRGLIALGFISPSIPPLQFQAISNWLNMQLSPSRLASFADDKDVVILPENTPLLMQNEENKEKPVWFKPVFIGGVLLLASFIFVFMLKLILFRSPVM